MDAAGHDRLDQRPHMLFGHCPLVFLIAGEALAVSDALVLQIAFAALVANRAIERVVDEQKLHHPFARLFHLGRGGHHHLAIGGGHRATGDGFRRLFQLDKAHAAIARDAQPFMIAKARHFDAGGLAGLQHGGAGRDFDFDTIDGQFRHGSAGSCGGAAGNGLTIHVLAACHGPIQPGHSRQNPASGRL